MQSSFWTRFEFSFPIYAKIFFLNYENSVIYNGKPAKVLRFLICILNIFGSNLGRDADSAD